MNVQRIMVAIDGSEPSDRAVDFAAALAEQLGAELVIVAVADVGQLAYYDSIYRDTGQLEVWQERIKDGLLTRAAARAALIGPAAETVLLKGRAAPSLLHWIRSQEPDLVVMGRTGKGAVERLLEGSVSRKISSLSPSPVTLIA